MGGWNSFGAGVSFFICGRLSIYDKRGREMPLNSRPGLPVYARRD